MTSPRGPFIRAIVRRDEALLARIAKENPVFVQYSLDAAMRGLALGYSPLAFEMALDEPRLRNWVNWLIEQDHSLRQQLGWEQRQGDICVLRTAYNASDLALVLGAGISQAAKMPGWDALVSEMIDRALNYGNHGHHRKIAEAILTRCSGDDVPVNIHGTIRFVPRDQLTKVLAEEIKPADPETRERLEAARAQLKKDDGRTADALLKATEMTHKVFGDEFTNELRHLLYERRLYRTQVHPAIARMVRPRNQQPGTRTARVHTILTYNFDDLLELALREAEHECWVFVSKGGQIGRLRPGWPLGQLNKPSAVDVCHVHGFCPNPRGAYAFTPLDDVDLVFSEMQYHVAYGEEASWVKHIQTAMFGNSPCLFLGCSLRDDYAVNQLVGQLPSPVQL